MITRFCFGILLVGVFLCSPLSLHAAAFHDSLGRAVTLSSAPMRLISLAPSVTEMIYFLGLGDRLVGVTRFSSFPREARSKPKVGTYTNINIEKVISLDPDLVIGTMDGNRREDVEMLEEVAIPVYVINPRTVGQVLDTLERLGEICGVTDRSQRRVFSLRERVLRVERAVRHRERPLVLLVINVKPLMSVNGNTIHHNIIHMAGGRNMTGDQPITYPKLNMEEVIRKGPDVIIISSMEKGREFENAKQEWFRWPTVPAVSNGKVYLIDSDLIDRPAPRIVSGLEEIARLLHPEVVWNERQ
jgi:iron complex transport system substrate-binding protein